LKLTTTLAAKSVVRTRFVGSIVGLTAFSAALSGTAYADTGQDAGPNRNQSRQQADKPTQAGQSARPVNNKFPDDPAALNAAKAQLTIRDEVENVAAAAELTTAAGIRDDLEDTASYAMSPAAEQAAFGGAVPTVGMGGIVPNARALAAYIINTYPGVQSIGGVRSDPLPDHPSGHAIDIMIGSDMGLGDAINADVQGQAGRFGVVYTMWRVANHFNHVHVTVS
jgi:hypothetical protein